MQIENLTPFQRKLIAVILLRALGEDPIYALVQQSNPEVQQMLAEGFVQSDTAGADGTTWVALSQVSLEALLSLFYPNVTELYGLSRRADQLYQEGNTAALAQIDIR